MSLSCVTSVLAPCGRLGQASKVRYWCVNTHIGGSFIPCDRTLDMGQADCYNDVNKSVKWEGERVLFNPGSYIEPSLGDAPLSSSRMPGGGEGGSLHCHSGARQRTRRTVQYASDHNEPYIIFINTKSSKSGSRLLFVWHAITGYSIKLLVTHC